MDGIGIIQSVVLGVVEGLTEFLPISSTGHLILAAEMLGAHGEKAKLFEVFIQLGAILAVLWIYRRKIVSVIMQLPAETGARRLALGLVIAFLPAAVVGLVAHNGIKKYLFSPYTVAVALFIGGLVIMWIESRKHSGTIEDVDKLTLRSAFLVGIAQVFALVPGVSRAGATIMGGLLAGMSRKTATEFSFFLAIPTMLAATTFDLAKGYSALTSGDMKILAVGFIAAFISALWVVRWLLAFISHNDFKLFAWYRIIFGIFLMLLYYFR